MASASAVINFAPITDAIASKSFDKLSDICDNLMLHVAAEGVSFQSDWPYSIHLLAHIYADDINSARFLWKSIPLDVKESQPEAEAAWRLGQKLWTRDYAGVYEAIRGFNWSPEAQAIVSSFSGRGWLSPFVDSMADVDTFQNGDSIMLFAVPLGGGGSVSWLQLEKNFKSIFDEPHLIVHLYTRKMFQLLLSAYSTIDVKEAASFLGLSEDEATKYALQEGWTLDPASRMLTVQKQLVIKEQKLDQSNLQRLTEYVFHLEH